MKDCFVKEGVKFHLVPPHNHRANAAERAIQTFKNHLIAGLSGLDPQFPIKQWDCLLKQAELTLNLLRLARLNPKLSANSFLFGEFDFTRTPLAPICTKVRAHVKRDTRYSWDPRGQPGWYIGPALEHHRCVTCYFPKTRAERVVDTVQFFPHSIPVPAVTLKDFLKQAASDIVTLLKNPHSTIYPSLTAGDPIHTALTEIATLLNRYEPLPESTTSTTSITSPSTPSTTTALSSEPSLPPSTTNSMPLPRVAPSTSSRVSLPRVAPTISSPVSLPRVQPSSIVPPSISSIPSKSPSYVSSPYAPIAKDDYIRFPTRRTRSHGPPFSHRYPLRHRTSTSSPLLAQHSINHIFDDDGKKLTLSNY